jgi:hypothetical protein
LSFFSTFFQLNAWTAIPLFLWTTFICKTI